MNVIFGILALIGVLGLAITTCEHRKKRALLAKDLDKETCNGVQAQHLTDHQTGPHIF